jgi:hypothetical protein
VQVITEAQIKAAKEKKMKGKKCYLHALLDSRLSRLRKNCNRDNSKGGMGHTREDIQKCRPSKADQVTESKRRTRDGANEE